MIDQELEVKLYLTNLSKVRKRVEELGAAQLQARIHEINLRFDTQDLRLSKAGQVLRLRQDNIARLTFKGPTHSEDGVRAREEIEFTVNNFHTARRFLTALGYHVLMIYEKYRTTYEWKSNHITLDEMPYGNFIEIEGPDPALIHQICEELNLNWSARIFDSYTTLFDQLREKEGYSFRDILFENFENVTVTPETLGVMPADKVI
jgi:adenylate cyclase class 2